MIEQPRPLNEAERLRLYLLENPAYCRRCNCNLFRHGTDVCPGCGARLSLRAVSAGRRNWMSDLIDAAASHRRPRTRRRRVTIPRPRTPGALSPGPLTDAERMRVYLLENEAECPHCGYDLLGLESDICPECGRTLTVAAIRRGRRRWFTAAFVAGLAPLIGLVATGLAMTVKAAYWLIPEYGGTLLPVLVALPFVAAAAGLAWLAMTWIRYATVIPRLPAIDRWGLVLLCWVGMTLAAGLVALA